VFHAGIAGFFFGVIYATTQTSFLLFPGCMLPVDDSNNFNNNPGLQFFQAANPFLLWEDPQCQTDGPYPHHPVGAGRWQVIYRFSNHIEIEEKN
jgi:hypothetical protein